MSTTMDLVHKKLVQEQRLKRKKLIHPDAIQKRIEEGAARRATAFGYGKWIETAGGGFDRSRG